MLPQEFLPSKAADSSIMEKCWYTAPWFSIMQGLKLLKLRWRSLLGHSYDVVDSIIAYNGGQ